MTEINESEIDESMWPIRPAPELKLLSEHARRARRSANGRSRVRRRGARTELAYIEHRVMELLRRAMDGFRADADDWRRGVQIDLANETKRVRDELARLGSAKTPPPGEAVLALTLQLSDRDRDFTELESRFNRLADDLLEAAGRACGEIAQREIDLARSDIASLRRYVDDSVVAESHAVGVEVALVVEGGFAATPRNETARQSRLATGAARGLAGVAAAVAGSRRASGREAWLADLAGVPETGRTLSGWRQLGYAAGLIHAAVRMRLGDLAGWAGGWLDRWLATDERVASGVALAGAAVVAVHFRDGGISTVLQEWESVLLVSGSVWGVGMFLRRIRGVTPLPRGRKKDPAQNQ